MDETPEQAEMALYEQAVEQFNRQQLAKAEAAAERRRIQDTLAKQAAEAPPSPL